MKPPLTTWVPARELRVGDYVQGEGEIATLRITRASGYVFVTYGGGNLYSIFDSKQSIEIRLEDDGR